MINSALHVHLSFLMHQGEFARVIGTLQAVRPAGTIESLMRTFLHVSSGHQPYGVEQLCTSNCIYRTCRPESSPDGLVSPLPLFPDCFKI